MRTKRVSFRMIYRCLCHIDDLDDLLTKISEHLVDEDIRRKMYTIHSYKGMENDIVRIHDDIDILNEANLYYVLD